jgi:hypothetical protein
VELEQNGDSRKTSNLNISEESGINLDNTNSIIGNISLDTSEQGDSQITADFSNGDNDADLPVISTDTLQNPILVRDFGVNDPMGRIGKIDCVVDYRKNDDGDISGFNTDVVLDDILHDCSSDNNTDNDSDNNTDNSGGNNEIEVYDIDISSNSDPKLENNNNNINSSSKVNRNKESNISKKNSNIPKNFNNKNNRNIKLSSNMRMNKRNILNTVCDNTDNTDNNNNKEVGVMEEKREVLITETNTYEF